MREAHWPGADPNGGILSAIVVRADLLSALREINRD